MALFILQSPSAPQRLPSAAQGDYGAVRNLRRVDAMDIDPAQI